jgi:flavorubredoxin
MEILKDIHWVGAVDWAVKSFHGHTYTTRRGTTYNAYLIMDEKVALVDTVAASFGDEMIERIKAVVDPARIDYIIANHVETDHSGALPQLLALCPKAKIVGTAKCREGLGRHYYLDMDFQAVKTGDVIKLGRRSLTFLEAPMIHWPDSMFTYCPEEKLLMPNDAFGQHLASSERFDDEIDQCALMEEAMTYYANILWPLGGIISRKLAEVAKMDIPVSMIATSHGIIWRKDPCRIINAYAGWSAQKTVPRAVIVYETMWQSTAAMAQLIAEGLQSSGVPVKIFDVNVTDRTRIVTEMYEASGFLFGSSTHDNEMLPNLAGFLALIKGYRPKNRLCAGFGSYGWAGGAIKAIEQAVAEAGMQCALPSLAVQYVPDAKQRQDCIQYGRDFAELLKKN